MWVLRGKFVLGWFLFGTLRQSAHINFTSKNLYQSVRIDLHFIFYSLHICKKVINSSTKTVRNTECAGNSELKYDALSAIQKYFYKKN
jgi:hypothetical protein